MLNLVHRLSLNNYKNLSFYRRIYKYKKKDKIFAKLERDEIEKAVHNHFDENNDEMALK